MIICFLHYNSNIYNIKYESKFHTVGAIAIRNIKYKLHFIRVPILPQNVDRSWTYLIVYQPNSFGVLRKC